MDNTTIINKFEEYDILTTEEPTEAMFILTDGTLISGMFEYGYRTEDHRAAEILVDDVNRYDNNFWEVLHNRTDMIQLVPETKYALYKVGQRISAIQREVIESLEYIMEAF